MDDNPLHPRTARAWAAPLISTIITLPLAFAAWFLGAISLMACESCNDAQVDRFDSSFDTAWTVLCTGLLTALAVLVMCWCLAFRQRRTASRTALVATLAPAVVCVAFTAFLGIVDWP